MTSPEIVALTPVVTVKMRKAGVLGSDVSRSTITPLRAGPSMSTLLSTTSSPLVRSTVAPSKDESNWMVSPLLAAASASRRDPEPLSAVLVTVITDGTMRWSSRTRSGRKRAGERLPATGRRRAEAHGGRGLRIHRMGEAPSGDKRDGDVRRFWQIPYPGIRSRREDDGCE